MNLFSSAKVIPSKTDAYSVTHTTESVVSKNNTEDDIEKVAVVKFESKYDTTVSKNDNDSRHEEDHNSTPANNRAYRNELMSQGILKNDGTITATLENVEKLSTQHAPKQYEKKDESFWSKRKLSKVAYWYHLVCFASAMILSASCFSWNEGLHAAGFPAYTIAVLLISTAFQIMAMCLAELCSGLPFSGGSYGFVRATIGMKSGMFVGLIESLEYILTCAVNIVQSTALLSAIFDTGDEYRLLWDFSLVLIATVIQIIGGEFYWNFVLFAGGATMLVLILYSCSAFQYLGHYGLNEHIVWEFKDMSAFMIGLSNAVWFYVGIEAIPLTCEETHESKEQVPLGINYGMLTIIIISLFVYFTAVAVPTQNLLGDLFPLTEGYALTWNIDLTASVRSRLLVFALIPMFSASFTFIFCYGRQLFAMSRSGLIPQALSLTTDFSGTPYVAMIFGSSIVFFVCIFVRSNPDGVFVLTGMMLLSALTNYLFQLVAYIILNIQFPMLQRSYFSPVGIPGAVVAFCIFFLSLIGLLGWNPNIGLSIAGICIWAGTGMIYYYFVSQYNLILSPEEQFSMFMLYSLKFAEIKLNKLKSKKPFINESDNFTPSRTTRSRISVSSNA